MNLKSYRSCIYITNLRWRSVSSRTIYYPEYYKACDSHWYKEHFFLLTSSPLHYLLSIPSKFLYRCIPLFVLQEIPVCLKIGRIFMFPERRQHSTCLPKIDRSWKIVARNGRVQVAHCSPVDRHLYTHHIHSNIWWRGFLPCCYFYLSAIYRENDDTSKTQSTLVQVTIAFAKISCLPRLDAFFLQHTFHFFIVSFPISHGLPLLTS